MGKSFFTLVKMQLSVCVQGNATIKKARFFAVTGCYIRVHYQISLLILTKFEQTNEFLFPLKSWENHGFSDHFKGIQVN